MSAAPEVIRSYIDVPKEPRIAVVDGCLIRGWACSPNGIDDVQVLVDGHRVASCVPDGDRSDVAAAFPGVPGAGRSGFELNAPIGPLPAGDHDLYVVIRDGAGHEVRHHRLLTVYANPYHELVQALQLTGAERQALRENLAAAGPAPRFELWIDAGTESGLGRTVDSIAAQTYDEWTCRIVAGLDIPDGPLRDYTSDARVRRHASVADALNGDGDDFVAFLSAGELLLPDALLHLAMQLVETPAPIAYSDHDRIGPSGEHSHPDYAPDWSPEHLYSRNYVGGVFFVRRDQLRAHRLVADAPLCRYDLLLRLSESAQTILHVPRVLWSSPAEVPTDARAEAERQAVAAALARRRVPADVTAVPGAPIRRVRRHLLSAPKVSIIVPTTGRRHLVQKLVESLTARTAYSNYELVFIDNGRGAYADGIAYLKSVGVRVIDWSQPFNWAQLNNFGAHQTNGEMLLFLNDDIEIVDAGWLEELVAQAVVSDVGTVGALLLYPDGRIQHAGVFLVGYGGGGRHYLHLVDPAAGCYAYLDRVAREVTASTGACLMVRREVFNRVGGFDERFRIAFNDADLCMRLTELGYRNVWTPYSRLIHHESMSRKGTSIADDEARVWTRWRDHLLAGDRYHSPNLAKDRGDCAIDTSALNRRPPLPRP